MRCLPRIAWLPLLVCCFTNCLAEAGLWQGRQVSEFLDSLNDQGHRIIFSSAVVTDDLKVLTEPDDAGSFTDVAVVLQPHGLDLQKGPGSTWLVRRAEREVGPEAASPEIAGTPLPEIIVTSSLHRLEYAETGAVTYLDRELSARVPAAAEEAVRITDRLPSTANGGLSARNHVRGGETNEVLFLLDGHRLYEPFHLKDFQSIATIVNSNAIDGIDYYAGAYPARFGDRMSGVMNLSLRAPEKPVQTELAVSFFNTSILSMGLLDDGGKGDWLFAARRGNLDLIADAVNPEIGSPDYQDYLLHGSWINGPRTQISANFLYSNDKLILADIDRGESANANYENQIFWLNWRADWNNKLRSETVFSTSSISSRRSGVLALPQIVDATLNEVREFDALGIKQDWTYVASENWMLRFGFLGRHQDSDYQFASTMSVQSPFDQILENAPVAVRNFDQAPEGAQYGAYVEARWKLRERLIVDAGLRWDQQTYTTAKNDAQTSPRLSVLYRVNGRTDLRLGWGQFSQAQEINELQISDGVDTLFAAQRAEHVVINLKHRLGKDIDIDLSFYRKSFRAVRARFENAFNALTLLPELQFDRYRIDPQSAQAAGAELMVSKGGSGQSNFWWLSYAWSDVRDEAVDRNIARSWDQTHTFKAGFSWRWNNWDFSTAGELHTGWPKTILVPQSINNADGTTSFTLLPPEPNALRNSVFHTLDIRVSRDFAVRRGDLTVFMEVSNLYDRDNPCCTEYSVASSGGSVALIGEQANWLPLVPSIGVNWRF